MMIVRQWIPLCTLTSWSTGQGACWWMLRKGSGTRLLTSSMIYVGKQERMFVFSLGVYVYVVTDVEDILGSRISLLG